MANNNQLIHSALIMFEERKVTTLGGEGVAISADTATYLTTTNPQSLIHCLRLAIAHAYRLDETQIALFDVNGSQKFKDLSDFDTQCPEAVQVLLVLDDDDNNIDIGDYVHRPDYKSAQTKMDRQRQAKVEEFFKKERVRSRNDDDKRVETMAFYNLKKTKTISSLSK